MRICSRCKENLSLDAFQERASGYLFKQCRKCRLEVRHERYKDYPESKLKDQQRAKKWYEENKEKVAQKRKERATLRPENGKWHNIKYSHNLNKEEYLKILERQNGLCAICRQDKKLYIDHDHKCCYGDRTCGKCVRGLICQKCNMMMHYIDECKNLFDRAIEYSTERVKEIYE